MYTGIPHVSWSDDLMCIARALAREGEKVYDAFWDESWYHITDCIYKYNGLYFRIKVEKPRSSTGRDKNYHITMIPESEVPAIILGMSEVGEVHIVKQTTGTKDYCEDWVIEQARNMSEYNWFKIIKRAKTS